MDRFIITLDRGELKSIPFYVTQGDNKSQTIPVKLLKDGLSYNLTGKTIKLAVINSKGNGDLIDIKNTTPTTGEFDIPLDGLLTSQVGKCNIQIGIFAADGYLLHTSIIRYYVNESLFESISGNLEEDSSFKNVLEKFKKLDEWDAYFNATSGKIEEKYTTRLNKIDASLEDIPNISNIPFDIRIDVKTMTKNEELIPLEIETYVEKNNQVVHPSILYFEKKWNGFSYWLCVTPYTDTDSQWENPSIYCSNDGLNWDIPEGLINPIVPKPLIGYNADCNLSMSSDNKTMYCIWRDRGNGNRVQMKKTTDGVNWSNMITLIDNPIGGRDVAVPNMWYENNKYYMTCINLDEQIDAKRGTIQLYVSTNPEKGWVFIKDITIPNIPTGKELWHYELRKIGSMYVILYTIATLKGYGSGASLFLATSYDLEKWDTSSKPCVLKTSPSASSYKSSFIPFFDSTGLKLKVWYNETSWLVYYTEINTNIESVIPELSTEEKIMEEYFEELIFDDFNYADEYLINGKNIKPLSKLKTWKQETGVFKVLNKMLVPSVDGNTIASIEGFASNEYNISAKIKHALASQAWIIFRLKDTANYIRAGVTGSNVIVQLIERGIVKQVLLEKKILSDLEIQDVKININIIDDTFSIIINDVKISEITSAYNNSYYKFGLQCNKTTEAFYYIMNRTYEVPKNAIPNIKIHKENIINSINGIDKGSIVDTFNRIDNATNIGGLFTSTPAGAFGIKGKQAYIPSQVNGFALTNLNKTNYTLETTLSTVSNGASGLVFRLSDTMNFFRFIKTTPTNINIEKVISGSVTILKTLVIPDNELLKVEVMNDTIKCYSNDLLIETISDTFNSTATQVGLQCSNLSTLFKTFLAY